MIPSTICDICGVEIESDELKYHKRRERVSIVEVNIDKYTLNVQLIEGSFLCPVSNCGKPYGSIDSFKTHLKTHDNRSTVKVLKYEDPQQKKTAYQDFDFERGCRRALLDNEISQQNVPRAYYQALSLGCEPVEFHLNTKDKNESIPVPALIPTKTAKFMADHIKLTTSTISTSLSCEVQLHQEKSLVQPVKKKQATIFNFSILISKIVRASPLPGLLNHFEYQPPTASLLDNFNKDFRTTPGLLRSVAQLHTGAIITDGDRVLLLLTCEVYGRSKSVDFHSETSMKSLPPVGDKLFIGICEESDGRGIKKKLKIGTKHSNLLVTMSVLLESDNMNVNIGPETIVSGFSSKELSIYYPTNNISAFEEALSQGQDYDPPKDMNSFRQLVSGFNDPTTYHQYRATAERYLPVFETHIPATVFTLCDLPYNEKCGVSNTAASTIGSRFLCILAASSWNDDFKVSRESLKSAFQMYNAHGINKKSDQWKDVHKFVQNLENVFATGGDTIDVLQTTDLKLSSLANAIGQSLNTANKQIALNVETYLKENFGHVRTNTI